MRRLAVIAVLLVALVGAPPALGKEVLSVTACGSDGCSTSTDGGLLRAMTDVGRPTDAPAQAAAFYRLSITVGDGDEIAGHDRLSWVPSAGVLLTREGTWIALRPEIRGGLDELTRGLRALPAGRLDGFPATSADAAPPAQSPASPSTSAPGDSPIWILVTAAVALLISGMLVRGHRMESRPSRTLHLRD